MNNFGVVVPRKIFRSAELGEEGIEEVQERLFGRLKTVVYMNSEGYSFPLYFAIQEYKQSLKQGFKFYHPFGSIRTYLDGEDPYYPTDKIDKFTVLGPIGRRYFKYGDGKTAGGIESLLTILKLVLDPANHPVVFHCLGGFHRTGIVCMLIRVLQNWKWEDIVAEYHAYNPVFPRERNIQFVDRFIRDRRFLELKASIKDGVLL